MTKEAKAIGSALQNLPVRQMLRDLALGISEAQEQLDNQSIKKLQELATQRLEITDQNGNVSKETLLQLGIVPTFYKFREATIDISFSLSMHVEESASIGGQIDLNLEKASETNTNKELTD